MNRCWVITAVRFRTFTFKTFAATQDKTAVFANKCAPIFDTLSWHFSFIRVFHYQY